MLGRTKYNKGDMKPFVKTLAKQMIHNRWRTPDMRVKVQQRQS